MKNTHLNLENLTGDNDGYIKRLIERHSRPASEILLDDVDLRSLLKISRRTALEYRKKKIFPFYKLDNKIFYVLSEVINGIKKKEVATATEICYHCGEPLLSTHGNQVYHSVCAYNVKKIRSITQYATKSMGTDPLWRNEKILRNFFYKYGSEYEINPNDLASAGFDFKSKSSERTINSLLVIVMKHYGFTFLKNKKINLWKI